MFIYPTKIGKWTSTATCWEETPLGFFIMIWTVALRQG